MKKGYDVKIREKVVNLVLKQGRSMKEASRVFEIGQEVRSSDLNDLECAKKNGDKTQEKY